MIERDWTDSDLPLDEALAKKKEREHPTPERALFRAAVEKALSAEQRDVWEAWNYDRETLDSIGKRLGITHQAVSNRIKKIERRLIKWCQEHKEVYDALSGVDNGNQD